MVAELLNQPEEKIEGLDLQGRPWGDYPLDDVMVRIENRTFSEFVQKISKGTFVMNPDIQRNFVWTIDKQSKLIESVIMRIPLPVFYLAEDDQGRNIVVDGLQRLSTLLRFMHGDLKLHLPDRVELDGKIFSELPPRIQNRIDDCDLTFFVIDFRMPERARLDIFERVNSGVPLTRQQMRNSLYMGSATKFLKNESETDLFLEATGGGLSTQSMRDREFVNRFCAFRILGHKAYRGDMDRFLADCLQEMNNMKASDLATLSRKFRTSLAINMELFNKNPFRKSLNSVLNASLWDVMSTGFSYYFPSAIRAHKSDLVKRIHDLISDDEFKAAITDDTNQTKQVKKRFDLAYLALEDVLGGRSD